MPQFEAVEQVLRQGSDAACLLRQFVKREFQAVGGFFFKAAQFAFGGVEFAAEAFFEFGDFFFAALAAVVVEFFYVVHDGADFFQHGGFAGFKVCLVVFAHLLLLIGGWKGGQYSKAGRGQC